MECNIDGVVVKRSPNPAFFVHFTLKNISTKKAAERNNSSGTKTLKEMQFSMKLR
jgi:hypothetical protein